MHIRLRAGRADYYDDKLSAQRKRGTSLPWSGRERRHILIYFCDSTSTQNNSRLTEPRIVRMTMPCSGYLERLTSTSVLA